MRKFQCKDCEHSWKLPYGEEGQGIDLTCPQCGSKNVHRLGRTRGWGRNRRDDHSTPRGGQGWGRGWGNRREPLDQG